SVNTSVCFLMSRVTADRQHRSSSPLLCVSSCRGSLQAGSTGRPHHFCVFPHVEGHCRQAAQVGQHFCVFPHVEGHCRQAAQVVLTTSVCFLMSRVTAGRQHRSSSPLLCVSSCRGSLQAGSTGRSTPLLCVSS